jgi:hypothetical protein
MIDKKIEADIKEVTAFLELWGKFHSIYRLTIAKERISNDDEAKFLETKDILAKRYEEMRSSLDLKYSPYGRLTDPIEEILALKGIRLISEKNLKKLEADWSDAYVFLNSILERLKNNRRRFDQFNPVGVFIKRIFKRK